MQAMIASLNYWHYMCLGYFYSKQGLLRSCDTALNQILRISSLVQLMVKTCIKTTKMSITLKGLESETVRSVKN